MILNVNEPFREKPMQVNLHLAHPPAISCGALMGRLIGTAEDADRAGQRVEAMILVAMAYAAFDTEENCRDGRLIQDSR